MNTWLIGLTNSLLVFCINFVFFLTLLKAKGLTP